MKITYIYHKFPHHSKYSGYHQLVKYLENCPLKKNKVVERIKKIDIDNFRKLPFFLTHKTKEFYFPLEFGLGIKYSNVDEKPFLVQDDEKLVKSMFDLIVNNKYKLKNKGVDKTEKHIFHFIYGSLSFRYLKNFPLNNNIKVILTIHEPPKLINSWNYKKIFKKADAIIAMSKSQKQYLQSLTGKNNVFVILHGIDTKFFHPLENKKENKYFTTISVGHYLRDYHTLIKVIKKLKKKGYNCKHMIVGPSYNGKKAIKVIFKELFYNYNYSRLDNIELFYGIGDKELKRLYQTSDCLLLPLLDGTANNAVLEAMACGLPIISTDVGGIKEYVNDKCAYLEKKRNVKGLINKIVELKDNPELLKEMGIQSRIRSLDFEWSKVAKITKQVYEKIKN